MRRAVALLSLFILSLAWAQFEPSVASESHCMLQEKLLRDKGLDVIVIEHGHYNENVLSLLKLTDHNIQTYWRGQLTSTQPGQPYATVIWQNVRFYKMIAMTMNMQFPHNFCIFTTVGDREVRIIEARLED